MNNYLSDPIVFLVEILFSLYIMVVMLRFLFQLVRADFNNPISQFIVTLTNPLLRPLRRIIPSVGKIDMSSIVLMLLLQYLSLSLITLEEITPERWTNPVRSTSSLTTSRKRSLCWSEL